jgi:hypothetical protein
MTRFLSTAGAIAALLLASPALAQPHHGSHGPPGGGGRGPSHGVHGPGGVHRPIGGPWGGVGHHDFHGRDFNHFSPGERSHWRGGEWRHTWHDGRFGWWWYLDDGWFYYPEPIYPYPTYVGPPLIVEEAPPAPLPPPPHYWYQCADPAGFYPYVTNCPGGWRAVPATPPDIAPAPAPPAPAPPAR